MCSKNKSQESSASVGLDEFGKRLGMGFGKSSLTESKVGWFRKIRITESPDIAIIQETKCNWVNDNWVESIWGSSSFNYIQKPKVGKSGGLLVIWDPLVFFVNEAVEKQYFLAIKGRWKGKSMDTIIVNVYGPHKDVGKRKFWEDLDNLMNCSDVEWVIGGDFNEVRSDEERQNCVFNEHRAAMFNTFIENRCLVEIPLLGRKFTRISDNGLKFSKLDRFLVSENFIISWGDVSAIALDRRTSDHSPIILRDKNEDFGPKPFKFFDIWLQCPEVEPMIIDA
ncbi:uncharacterized protein [Rutidosis leptorrhynchoides]|uniref:uncharacterized protein n=1 Tax=Rutidosis leptorrhynchoides TaxID=125765 RepID=UPI003A99E28C